jgi:hypothetical protein
MSKSSFQCHYKFSNKQIRSAKALEVSQMHEPIYGTYPAFFVICPVVFFSTENEIKLPEYVRITDRNYNDHFEDNFGDFVGISYPNARDNNDSLAVCPGPAQNNFSNALRIAEFVEIYKLLGISKFYFYNMSVSDDVDKLFRHYESERVAEIHQWNIENVLRMDESIIHYFGIMATLNDCFYRATTVDNFKYVVIADFDEVIHPLHTHERLTDFLDAHDDPSYHSLLFSNFFVFADHAADFSSIPKDAVNKYLYTQAQVIRMKESTGDLKWFHVRTKFVAKRDVVTEVGNHYVWTALSGTKETYVDQKDAVMFHYRDDCIPGHCDKETAKDFSMRKYGNRLWSQVDAVCGRVFENGLCPRFDNNKL